MSRPPTEKPLKVLLVHNYYQNAGGEDVVFEQERKLLEQKGHKVIPYIRDNKEIAEYSRLKRIGLLKSMVAATDSRASVRGLLATERPDVVHLHNTFLLVSPSVYSACAEAGVPIVQTLHNYRLLCPSVNFFRDGKVCEECLTANLLRGIQHGCYRESKLSTAAVATMISVHHLLGTWTGKIDAYIALTEFARRKFIAGGLPAGRIHVKPNFVDLEPAQRDGSEDYVLFLGRLVPEKGATTLIEAWKLYRGPLRLKIAGEGPLREELESRSNQNHLQRVDFLGQVARTEALGLLRKARLMVVPSLWYEGFPMTIVESFAAGTPVIASGLGAMEEIIEHNRTGLHFRPGDAQGLADSITWAEAHPSAMELIGKQARREFENRYAPEINYQALIEIYNSVCNKSPETAETPAGHPQQGLLGVHG